MVCIGGSISTALMGDPNASIPTPQPIHFRHMFGAYGKSLTNNSITFVSESSIENNIRENYELTKQLVAVKNTRSQISKSSMINNSFQPNIEVNPETYEVRANGEKLTCEPATSLPLAQRYFLY